jgi:hypothetical protein
VWITIANWDKYNPRSDVKHASWFRVENTLLDDAAIYRLDNDAKMVWIALLARASQHMSGAFELEVGQISARLRVTDLKVQESLKDLQAAKRIQIHTSRPRIARRTRDTRARHSTGRDGTGHNGTGRDEGLRAVAALPSSLVEIWNTHKAPGMPGVTTPLRVGRPRMREATARLAEEPDLNRWREVVQRIARSKFCRGENDRGWVADFDFLVRAETFAKVLEGKYDDRASQKAEKAGKSQLDELYPLITRKEDCY